jgi:hypothetical protein
MVFVNKINNNNINIVNIPQSPDSFSGKMLFMLLTMFVVGLLIAGIVYLIKLAQNCLQLQGYYEPFVSTAESTAAATNNYKKNLIERIQTIQQLNTELDNSVDAFNSNIQDTCEVYAQIEDIYVGNNSGPASEEEYNLPKEELDRRLARRKQGAKKRFQETRDMYGSTMNTPVYECFENPAASIPELEDELRSELKELEAKLQNVDSGIIGQNGQRLNSLLKFNNKYIKKSLQEMGNEKARLLEGFDTDADTLIQRADMAIHKANAIFGNITNEQTAVKKQQELVKEMTNTVSRVERGNI